MIFISVGLLFIMQMVICKNDGRMIKIMHLICEAIPLANNPRQMRMHDRVSMNHNFMESGES